MTTRVVPPFDPELRRPDGPGTQFDSAGRSTIDELAVSAALLASDPGVMQILNAIDRPTFILDSRRQIVAANAAGGSLVQQFGGVNPVGLRLGEGVACVNAGRGPDGCGTAAECRYCGLGMANRQFGVRPGTYDGEVHLRSKSAGGETASTFHAHLAPLEVGGSMFRLLALTDVSGLKSREALEEIFFHDVLNTAQAVQGAATLIPGIVDPETLDQLVRVVSASASLLVGEIEAQRDLLRAEDGTLDVSLDRAHVWPIIAEVVELYRRSRFAKDRSVELSPLVGDDVTKTAPVFLARCVANLVKNALEASEPGQHVTVTVRSSTREIAIVVANPAVMPESVQAQVFQRFFSTKASSGRGLGTYSVRLLVTRALGGTVDFSSSAPSGTTFTIRLPRH